MGDAANIKMGTCNIEFDGVDLGLTMGGVEVEVTTNTHETKVDQYGDTVANESIMGRNITIRAPLAETTLQNMADLMPGAVLTGDSGRVDISTAVGTSLFNSAKALRIHPIELLDADHSEDLNVPLANTPGALSFAYKYDEERVFIAEFKGYPDSNGLLFTYGDPTAS